jgi:triosephosphate isomerase
MPRTIVAGNWKMHKTAAQTRAFFEDFLPRVERVPQSVHVVVAPAFTSIPQAREILGDRSRVALGAQNVNAHPQGAYTGEVSIAMLQEFGVAYAIVGHSERRAYYNETDEAVNAKVKALLGHGLTPIVAVGETQTEHEAGTTDERVVAQTIAALLGVSRIDVERVVLAYEPVWAIGTGANCDPAEANRVMSVIRGCVSGLDDVPILYGGSMKPENVSEYRAQPNINGGLVGGASLEPAAFARLIEAAAGA